ncbi:UDP-N-acetylmuramoyl-L-alanyl-D-glutamate--2,6-diaminopimelate ligase [Anaeromicrobium sediminis]|uniref:UDP-N-acetylmuramoyl-L-alanyl-D-glutamate--2,6-diaminopimelate ligase n=1 Tax=Anaeromicrobium sediminis TaxID=1478221 RepID=A0A267MGW2_9FIRM|nr:UDP-N-acetylmuramoyl-L-alanyl-D-glutamate--2,6-diaminopimelate ligase [Anaeromicrobium sediminis]PAB58824.1 UDP-N-acetylmuramoyl-L-alanyl-D-glutamate--2,6-diaminopimelate ligase [Anaeromicrobium sediminis]
MKLKDIINEIDVIDTSGDLNVEINNICYDSRNIKEGDLFVCVKGFKVDGHKYIDSVIKKGAKALVVEDEVNLEGVTLVKVSNSRKAMARIGANFYGNPTNQMEVIGITGTNGKTTITYLINSILDNKNVKSGIIGTICHKILNREYKANNTTPEAFELQKMFKEMKNADVDVAIMEVSSHSIELNRVDSINFSIGIFTNLTKDHLDYHEDMNNYYEAKKKLFFMTNKANIINVDDPYGKKLVEELESTHIETITYGIDNECDIKAENMSITPKGASFTLVTPKFSGEIKLNTPGKFSIYNGLAAASAAYILGYSFKDIKEGLENNKGVSGRFEKVENSKGYNVIVDYSHTPDSLENALMTAKEFSKGKIITVFGCGGDRDRTKRPMMGNIAGKLSDYVVITSDNPRSEEPNSILDHIEKGIIETNCEYKKIVDRKEGIREAIKMAKKDDVVLIAGKGHETYQILGDKTIDFDDRLVAKAIIEGEM